MEILHEHLCQFINQILYSDVDYLYDKEVSNFNGKLVKIKDLYNEEVDFIGNTVRFKMAKLEVVPTGKIYDKSIDYLKFYIPTEEQLNLILINKADKLSELQKQTQLIEAEIKFIEQLKSQLTK